MEQQKETKQSDNKKTLIICGSAVLIAAIALVCVIVLGGGANSGMDEDMGLFGGELTFEDFCLGMKKDLPEETMNEVKRLYEEAKQAMKDGDVKKIEKVYEELASLDVYDDSGFGALDVSDGTASSGMEAEPTGNWGD